MLNLLVKIKEDKEMYCAALKEVKIVGIPVGYALEEGRPHETELNEHLAAGWSLLTILTDQKLQPAGDAKYGGITFHTVTHHYAVLGR